MQDGDTRATYTYDPFGRRISKKVYEWDSEISDYKSPVSSFYLYSDEGLIAEFDASGMLTTAYSWKPGSVWMNSPVIIRTAKDGVLVTGYYLNDHLGAPQKVVDRSGAVIWSMQSTAFGKTTVNPAATIVSNLRFSSQYFDMESGLHYNTLRYYDPQMGRWRSKDPIGISGGLNLYVFCGNNTVNFVDPWGLQPTFLDLNPHLRTDAIVNDGARDGAQGFTEMGLAVGGVAVLVDKYLPIIGKPISKMLSYTALAWGGMSAYLGRDIIDDGDNDNDGIPDVLDPDDDNDGIPDGVDNDLFRHKDYDGDPDSGCGNTHRGKFIS